MGDRPKEYIEKDDTEDVVNNVENIERNQEFKGPMEAGLQANPGGGSPCNWRTVLHDYSQNTTLHGVKYITEDSPRPIRQLCWSVLVLASVCILIFYAQNRIGFFLEFSKNVNVEVNYLSSVKFPAVTVCNQNKFKITELARHDWYNMVKSSFLRQASTKEKRQCTNKEFKCDNGDCISMIKACNLFPDCPQGEDEKVCDPCPLLRLSSNLQSIGIQDIGIVHRNYILLPGPSPTGQRPLYVRDDSDNSETPVYLYHAGGAWRLGPLYRNLQEYLYIVSTASTPQHLEGPWRRRSDNGDYEVTLTVECAYKNMELTSTPSIPDFHNLTLGELMMNTSHKLDDFVKGCTWKGVDCGSDTMRLHLTDMGVCYTFTHPDMFVQSAGPGSGLILLLNIEFYEYTKDVSDGIGVKLHIHDDRDEPMVSESGVAISPGLYSFVSVETTQVTNLEPPWGVCGERKLDYFSNYTLSVCRLECEGRNLEAACHCRDLHHPHRHGQPPICTVKEYLTCAKPILESFRRAGSSCDCPTPCVQDTYVPTTSFAVVLGADPGGQDLESAALEEKLHTARETDYRIAAKKYRASMQQAHLVSQSLAHLRRYTRKTVYSLKDDFSRVSDLANRSATDCIQVKNVIGTLQRDTETYILQPLREFKNNYFSKLQSHFFKLNHLIDMVRNMYMTSSQNDTLRFESKTPINGTGMDLAGLIETMESGKIEIKTLIGVLQSNYLRDLDVPFDNIRVDYFRLHNVRLGVLLRRIGGPSCPWCSTNDNAPIYEILNTHTSNLYTETTYLLKIVENNIDLYFTHIHDYLIDIQELTTARYNTTYRTLILSHLHSITWELTDNEYEIGNIMGLLEQLQHFIWQQKCEVEAGQVESSFSDSHSQFLTVLVEVEGYVSVAERSWKESWENYRNGSKTLSDVGRAYDFKDIISFVGRIYGRIEAEIGTRLLKLHQMRRHFSQVNFLMTTLISDEELFRSFLYWKRFEMGNPIIMWPESIFDDTNSDGFNMCKTGCVTSSDENQFWEEVKLNLETTKSNFKKCLDLLVTAIETAGDYLGEYYRSTQLTPSFYEQNYLQVELFYKELTERKVSQQKAYEYQNLLSEIGGLMGLLLGASVLSVCELFDFLIYKCFWKRNCPNKGSKVTPSLQ